VAEWPTVIGINRTQDASVCLAREHSLVSIQKERLTRRKHHWGRLGDLALYTERIPALREPADLIVECYSSDPEIANMPEYQRELSDVLPASRNARRLQISHHLSHLYATFPFAPFRPAAVLIIDCAGSHLRDVTEAFPDRSEAAPDHVETSSLYRRGPEGYECLDKQSWSMDWSEPQGLGAFYFLLSRTLFGGEGNEGKVMGLAPYGNPAKLGLPPLNAGGGAVRIPPEWNEVFRHFERYGHFVPGGTGDFADSADLAAAGQLAFEEALLSTARWAHEVTGSTTLCFAGGTALNCVANSRLLAETPFTEVFVSPFPHDGGTAVGCALYGLDQLGAFESMPLVHDFLGPTPDIAVLDLAPDAPDLLLEMPDDLPAHLAGLLGEGAVVGLFQGGSELGPRALGNRSLLADPRDDQVRDWINEHIKGRESFRPLAPVALLDRIADYFTPAMAVPFMQFTVEVRPEQRASVPAVTHVDGTARLQTVTADENPFLYAVIAAFAHRTGVPILLNTSLNGPGEPIVETVREAVAFFRGSPMDALAVPPFLLRKRTPPRRTAA